MWFYVIWLIVSYICGVLYAIGFTSMKYIKFQDWIDEEKRSAERKAIILISIGLLGVLAVGVYGFIEEGWLFLLLLAATQVYNAYGQKRHVERKRAQQASEDAKTAEDNVKNKE